MVAHFWIGIGIMGLGFILSWQIKSINSLWFWTITLLTRILLLAMYPSDDIWRYLWEGYIQNSGFSPYEFAPTAPELIPYRTDWWELINNKDTAAIYPPLTQLGFRLLAFLAPSVLIFKIAFVGADLGICGLLSQRFGFSQSLLYAWNPLIIYSFAGGGHYDSWFILPLVAGWLAFEQKDPLKSAVLIGLSAAVKWISFPLLLFLLFKTRWKQRVIIVLLGILPLFITALLFCHDGQCSLIPTRSAFVSHGRSAEFIPYLVGLVWPLSTQYNWIYAIPLGLMIVLLLRFCRDFTDFIEGYFFCLLILSPIVHAWYFTWIVPWTVATRNLGVRWVSLSAFIYFVLKDRQTLGNFDWTLTPLERYWLWLPLIIGFLWTKFNSKSRLHSI